MSNNKGFGKFILFCAAVGAAAAGAYYYLSKREEELADNFDDDDFDEFDDFDDDDFDFSDIKLGSRNYVDITSARDDEDKADDSAEPVSSEEFFDDEDKE